MKYVGQPVVANQLLDRDIRTIVRDSQRNIVSAVRVGDEAGLGEASFVMVVGGVYSAATYVNH